MVMVTCYSYPIRNSLFIYVLVEGMIPIQSNWLVLEAHSFVGQFSAQLFPTVLSLYILIVLQSSPAIRYGNLHYLVPGNFSVAPTFLHQGTQP